MSTIRRRGRAFLGLPALDDPAAMKRLRVVPWLAAPAAFVCALAVWTAVGIALQRFLDGPDDWQVNAPALSGLTAILLLAPSSPTQPKARNAWLAAIVGLAVVGGGLGAAAAGHEEGTAYGAAAFAVATAGALAGCVGFTALTRVDRWSTIAQAGSATGTAERTGLPSDGPLSDDPPSDGLPRDGATGADSTDGQPPTDA